MRKKHKQNRYAMHRAYNQKRNIMRKTVFTLIEFLIIVTVIMILISILLPTLQKTRASAHLIQCTSNLKQLATAFQSYLGDYNDFYPLVAPVHSWNIEAAGDAGRWYNTGFQGLHMITPYLVPGMTQCYKDRPTNPVSRVFVCPANSLNPNNTQANYTANYFVFGNPNEAPLVYKAGKMKSPTKIFITAEGITHTFDYNTSILNIMPASDFENHTTSGVYQWHFRHERRMNFAFGDGHAATLRPPFFGIGNWEARGKSPFYWYNY